MKFTEVPLLPSQGSDTVSNVFNALLKVGVAAKTISLQLESHGFVASHWPKAMSHFPWHTNIQFMLEWKCPLVVATNILFFTIPS